MTVSTPYLGGSNVSTSLEPLTFLLDPAIERGGHGETAGATTPRSTPRGVRVQEITLSHVLDYFRPLITHIKNRLYTLFSTGIPVEHGS